MSLKTLQQQIIALYISVFNEEPSEIIALQGDASTRRYVRVLSKKSGCIACYDPAFVGVDVAHYPFLIMHKLLVSNHISVPKIVGIDAAAGVLLLEDCGDLLLQEQITMQLNSKETLCVEQAYQEMVELMVAVQSIKGDRHVLPFTLCFDSEKLLFEFDFFLQHALQGYFASEIDAATIPLLRQEFEALTDLLVQPEHFVLNHRDFHSRNIMRNEQGWVLIDFQDARMGLPQYDAVSLLRDSYVVLPDAIVESMKALHYKLLCEHHLTTMTYTEYCYYFDLMGFQRAVKAIGTFCYQAVVKQNRSYEQYIAPTLHYIVTYLAKRPQELGAVRELLQPILKHAAQP